MVLRIKMYVIDNCIYHNFQISVWRSTPASLPDGLWWKKSADCRDGARKRFDRRKIGGIADLCLCGDHAVMLHDQTRSSIKISFLDIN